MSDFYSDEEVAEKEAELDRLEQFDKELPQPDNVVDPDPWTEPGAQDGPPPLTPDNHWPYEESTNK